MDVYNFPDPNNESRHRNIEKSLENAGDKYVLVYTHNLLFERMWFLRGLNNLMQDFLLEPGKIHELKEIFEKCRTPQGGLIIFDYGEGFVKIY